MGNSGRPFIAMQTHTLAQESVKAEDLVGDGLVAKTYLMAGPSSISGLNPICCNLRA